MVAVFSGADNGSFFFAIWSANIFETFCYTFILPKTGLEADYFSIGDCKAIHLQGTIGTLDVNETLYAFILGFDHNSEIEGKGISFGTFKTAESDGVDVAFTDALYA